MRATTRRGRQYGRDQREVQRVVNGLVSTELDQRVAAFEEAIKALDDQINRWSELMDFVMPDSSLHPDKLEEADFASLLNLAWTDHHVHVLVPIVVVDELDRLKESKDPRCTLACWLHRCRPGSVFKETTGVTMLRKPEFSTQDSEIGPRGPVTIELLFDPQGHVRLPINDDEIIDRALAAVPLAAREVGEEPKASE